MDMKSAAEAAVTLKQQNPSVLKSILKKRIMRVPGANISTLRRGVSFNLENMTCVKERTNHYYQTKLQLLVKFRPFVMLERCDDLLKKLKLTEANDDESSLHQNVALPKSTELEIPNPSDVNVNGDNITPTIKVQVFDNLSNGADQNVDLPKSTESEIPNPSDVNVDGNNITTTIKVEVFDNLSNGTDQIADQPEATEATNPGVTDPTDSSSGNTATVEGEEQNTGEEDQCLLDVDVAFMALIGKSLSTTTDESEFTQEQIHALQMRIETVFQRLLENEKRSVMEEMADLIRKCPLQYIPEKVWNYYLGVH